MDASRIDDELRARAKAGWTGRLTVSDRAGRELADLYIFEGDLYSVQMRDHQPHLFTRLVAAGIIDGERQRECDSAGAPGARDEFIGRYAVEHGWLPVERLAEFHSEYLLAGLSAVREASGVSIADEPGAMTNVRCALPSPVADVIASVELRTERSRNVWVGVGASAGPRETVLAWRGVRGVAPFVAPELAAFAAEVDGVRSVDELADSCGFTRAEAEFLTAALVNDGLVEVAGVKSLPAATCLVPEDAARAGAGARGVVGP
ncbi:MAG: hypothetical protein F2836_03750 [Actinobacteria bacterium]|uniref:Unannotated protein n=1 Tax=freshwater metagenome TaxID=449393 RepID=A0A6J7IMC3_9ZZZZ|nr:hypothetical protein [Actinomycetota bacterium]